MGQILAVKGLGGYQLICDARQEETILALRQRKNREAKPFALMVANIKSAERLVEIDRQARRLLVSRARPIVLLKKRDRSLPEAIAPGLNHYGLMLPSTPLHYLLFHAFANYPEACHWLDEYHATLFVVTSANLSGHPLMIDDAKALDELAPIADQVVTYNRQIVTRVDDSVLRIIQNSPVFIRRARGFVPESIKLPHAIPSTLALGGYLKNTVCVTRHDEAFVSQHIGCLNNKETIEFFHETITHLQHFLAVNIECIACDWHPDFYTTQMAAEYQRPVIAVQHHHAHLASVAAEHHILSPVLGLALDGYGYGIDGEAWGGELLLVDEANFQHLGSLSPLPLPGGDVAMREPWRMGAAVLHCLGKDDQIVSRFASLSQAPQLAHWLASEPAMPSTSSCGRLFDAASALLGINLISQYEGQAAQQLESLVSQMDVLSNGWYFDKDHLNLLPTLAHLLHLDPVAGANLFHATLIEGLAEWTLNWAERLAINVILLGGGCFLNKVLSEGLIKRLTEGGLMVYWPKRLPPNDGGLSLGQAWVAGRSAE